ncbi:MAG: O-antigen polysaccharide polymerase Wzy [Burkholderiales bacterium]|nr:O-antigen polysaccharide polymerase Wzy [Opitutaceae bacterium]
MSAPSALDYNQPPDPASCNRLFQAGIIALGLTSVWFLFRSAGELSLQTLFGLAVLILAALPALRWARLQRRWFPVFEIACLIYVAFYALPLLSDHSELDIYPDAVVGEAGLLVTLYLGMAVLAFEFTSRPARSPAWLHTSLLPTTFAGYVPVGQSLNTVYLYIITFTQLIPFELAGSLRALFFGLGTLSTFILARQAGLGALSRQTTGLFVLNIVLQVFFHFAQLYLIGGISLLALTLIAYVSARRQVPWITCIVVLPMIAFLHLGKPGMRATYWQGGAPLPTVFELPGFFGQWIDFSQRELRVVGTEEQTTPSNLLERASLIQMLCLSVDRIPSLKPHLEGETYVDVPAQIIPRFLWPNKPSGLYSNVRLAIYFNLVSADSALNVSIAFGMLAEAYANFGVLGVLFLGFLMGFIGRRISMLAENTSMFSTVGILMILLTAWSFQVELVLATWLGSLMQAMIVCIGLPLLYRRLSTA